MHCSCILLKFYIKPQLMLVAVMIDMRCILLKFYIKPQPSRLSSENVIGCILLKFYIKPQLKIVHRAQSCVVSY